MTVQTTDTGSTKDADLQTDHVGSTKLESPVKTTELDNGLELRSTDFEALQRKKKAYLHKYGPNCKNFTEYKVKESWSETGVENVLETYEDGSRLLGAPVAKEKAEHVIILEKI